MEYSFEKDGHVVQKRVHYFLFRLADAQDTNFGPKPPRTRELLWIKEAEIDDLPLVNDPMDRIQKIIAEGKPIDEAMRRGVQQALRLHRLLGYPIAVWRDGQVVWIPPEEIPVDTDETSSD